MSEPADSARLIFLRNFPLEKFRNVNYNKNAPTNGVGARASRCLSASTLSKN